MSLIAKIAASFFTSGLGKITQSVVDSKKARLNAQVALAKSAAGQDRVKLNAEIKKLELELLDLADRRQYTKTLLDSSWMKIPVFVILAVSAYWFAAHHFRGLYSGVELPENVQRITEFIIYGVFGGAGAGALAHKFMGRK